MGSQTRYPVFSIEFSARRTNRLAASKPHGYIGRASTDQGRCALDTLQLDPVQLFEIMGPQSVDACCGRIDRLSREWHFRTEFGGTGLLLHGFRLD
jgi:hypothetical protein